MAQIYFHLLLKNYVLSI